MLRSRVLAGVRCVDAQTLQAYSRVCPGKVPREQVHLAHMLGALWLFWPPVCRLARITRLLFFPRPFCVKITKRWRILLLRCRCCCCCCLNASSDRRPQKVSDVRGLLWFISICHWGTMTGKEMSNLKYYMSKCVQSKPSITQRSLVMRFSFIWGKEHCSSFLLCFPFSFYSSFITMHVSSHVSLSSLCTFLSAFLLSPRSTFLPFPSLSLSSTLCSFHSLY